DLQGPRRAAGPHAPEGPAQRGDVVRLQHYYHVYANRTDGWKVCVEEHCDALKSSGLLDQLDGPVIVGVVGDRLDRRLVREAFRAYEVPVWISSSVYTTWEQRTLAPLWAR